MPSHQCPVRGCRRFRRRSQVMCKEHWFRVPAGLRSRIWSLFGRLPGGTAHRQAVARAIRIVNAEVAREEATDARS